MENYILINILKNVSLQYMSKTNFKPNMSNNIILILKYKETYYSLSENEVNEINGLSFSINPKKSSDLELLEFLIHNNIYLEINIKYQEILNFCINMYNTTLSNLDLKNENLIQANLETNFYNLLETRKNNENFQFLSVFYNKINSLNENNFNKIENRMKEILTFSNFKNLCSDVYKKVDEPEKYFFYLNEKKEIEDEDTFLKVFFKSLKKTFIEFLIKYTIIKKNSAMQTNYFLINEFGLSVFRLYISLSLLQSGLPKRDKISLIEEYEKYYIEQQQKPENMLNIFGQYFLTFFEELYANIIQEKIEVKTENLFAKNKKQNISSYYYNIKGLDENTLLEYMKKTQLRLPLRYTPPIDWTCEKTAEGYNLKDNYTGCYSNNEKIKIHPMVNVKLNKHEILLINRKTIDAINLAQKKPFILDWNQIDYYKNNRHKTLITKNEMNYLKIKEKKDLIDLQKMSKYYEQYFLIQDVEKYKNDYLNEIENQNFILNQKLYETYQFSVTHNIFPEKCLTYVPLSLEWRLRWTQTSAIGYLTSDIFRSFMSSPKPYIVNEDDFYVIIANKLFSIKNFNVDLCKQRIMKETFFSSGYKNPTEINSYLLSINCSEIVDLFKIINAFFNLKKTINLNYIIEKQTDLLVGLDNTSSGQQLANIALLNGYYSKQLNLENNDEVVHDLYSYMGQEFYNNIKNKFNTISNQDLQKIQKFESEIKHERFRVKYTKNENLYFTYSNEELIFNNNKSNTLNRKKANVNILENDSESEIDHSETDFSENETDASDIDSSNPLNQVNKTKKKYFINIYWYPESAKEYHLLNFLNAIDINSKLYRNLIKAILMPASYNAKEKSLREPIKNILLDAENKKSFTFNHFSGIRTVFINAFLKFINLNNLLTLNKLINLIVKDFLKSQKKKKIRKKPLLKFYWYHLSGAYITPGYMKREGDISKNRYYYTIPSPFFKRGVTKNIRKSVVLKPLTQDVEKLTTSTSPNIIHGLDSALIHHIILNLDHTKCLFCVHDCFLMPINELSSFKNIYPEMLISVFCISDNQDTNITTDILTKDWHKFIAPNKPFINTLVDFLKDRKRLSKTTKIKFLKLFSKLKKTHFSKLDLDKLKTGLFLSIK